MGSFAKRLGQLSARSLETESKNILRTGAANKVPGSLAMALDGTLRQGHDMKTFGVGTMASMANKKRYARFTASMSAVYGAMEAELDAAGPDAAPAVHAVWSRHGGILRRASALAADYRDVSPPAGMPSPSPATARYVSAIRTAGAEDRKTSGARMLGHLYCRYFADLFGGQMLATPYRVALALSPGTPRHYVFDFPDSQGGRRAFIEGIYQSFNEVGGKLSPHQRHAVIDEALLAFKLNVDVYSEEPIWLDGARGAVNVGLGFARGRR